MELSTHRRLVFKAWDKESRLMVRLDTISCVKGELVKKDHILLQFTGQHDLHGEELYEQDIVIVGSSSF
jgi:hypothetical protein